MLVVLLTPQLRNSNENNMFHSTLIPFISLLIVPFAFAKTNIIFIMADDLGYGDLGCFGQELIMTPELDKMAKEGMKFTRFYAGSHVLPRH